MGGPGGTTGLRHELLRRKPVGSHAHEGEHVAGGDLQRSIGTFQLTMFGVGATIGTGIFFVMSSAVPEAGPAVVLAFVMAGIAAGLAAICYAEMASSVPVSGSTYSYAYATLGEIVAMGVAACLLLEYGVSTAAVAVGWSGYLNEALAQHHRHRAAARDPRRAAGTRSPASSTCPPSSWSALCALLLIRGASESARVNAIMVVIKLTVLAMFIVIALHRVRQRPTSPTSRRSASRASATAAGTIFFSFIGLDAVSTAGDEVKDPQRTMPRALIAALIIVIVVLRAGRARRGRHPAVAGVRGPARGRARRILEVVTGQHRLGHDPRPRRRHLDLLGHPGDALRPDPHPVRHGPRRHAAADVRAGSARARRPRCSNTIIVAIVVAILAAFVPLDYLIDVVSIGTLTAFIVVSLGVIILRRREPDLPRALQGAGLPGHAGPVDPRLRLHPGQPALVHVVDLRRLGGGVPDLLHALRAQALVVGRLSAARSDRRAPTRSTE